MFDSEVKYREECLICDEEPSVFTWCSRCLISRSNTLKSQGFRRKSMIFLYVLRESWISLRTKELQTQYFTSKIALFDTTFWSRHKNMPQLWFACSFFSWFHVLMNARLKIKGQTTWENFNPADWVEKSPDYMRHFSPGWNWNRTRTKAGIRR